MPPAPSGAGPLITLFSHLVQDFFLCSLLLRIVSAGWCD
ncbi:RepA leader peptide Tap [Escherichia coli]